MSAWIYFINKKLNKAVKCRQQYIGCWEVVEYRLGKKPKLLDAYQARTREEEWPSIVSSSGWVRMSTGSMKFLEKIDD